MSYDIKCYELAVAFLEDHPDKDTRENRDELAQHIQTEIEDVIEHTFKPKQQTQKNVNPSGRAPFGWHICKP